jgi:hypothetical protein
VCGHQAKNSLIIGWMMRRKEQRAERVVVQVTTLLLVLFLTSSLGLAQSQTLALSKTIPLPKDVAESVSITTLDAYRCDSDGNMLLPLDVPSDELAEDALVRLSSTGEVFKIVVRSVPEFENAVTDDFSTGPNGTTYVLASQVRHASFHRNPKGEIQGAALELADDNWLLVFDAQGRFTSRAKLNVAVRFPHVGVFRSGNLLVLGPKADDSSFAGIFSASGELIREVSLPEIVDAERVRIVEDGNAYIVTGGHSPRISVVSPNGDLVSSTLIALPEGVKGLGGEQFAAGKMAAALEYPLRQGSIRPSSFAVFDSSTGKVIARYESDIFFDTLVCYSPTGLFTFLPQRAGALRVFGPSAK